MRFRSRSSFPAPLGLLRIGKTTGDADEYRSIEIFLGVSSEQVNGVEGIWLAAVLHRRERWADAGRMSDDGGFVAMDTSPQNRMTPGSLPAATVLFTLEHDARRRRSGQGRHR